MHFPPAPKLNVLGKLDPAQATPSELRGQEIFLGKGQCGTCHPAPWEVMINGRKASADGPIKTFPLRGIKDSPPHLHDDRCSRSRTRWSSSTW
jgi:hypothetical protein